MPQYQKNALKIWLEKSKKEIDILNKNLKNKDLYYSYFIGQQAFEKLFKILISIHWLDFEKTHNLLDLYTIAKNIYWDDLDFLKWNSIIFDKLSTMFFDERYWFDRINYVQEEIEQITSILEKLSVFASDKLA